MPPFWSAGNGTSTHAGYRFSDSSVITHTAHNSFICMCCWYKFVVIHEEKNNMFWLFWIVENTLRKIVTWMLYTLSPVGSLTKACNREQRSRWIWVMQGSLVLRLPLIEKKAELWYSGKKSCFCLLFHNLKILCPIILFILLPIISSTETISEWFWCNLEKICCIVCARLRLQVKMASSSK